MSRMRIAAGLTSMLLGGGRAKKGDQIDHAVGVVLHAKVGDELEVKVIAIDDQDRVKLSRKAVLREQAEAAKGEAK